VSGPVTFVTHYHRADRRPFQNLTEVPEDQAAEVLAGLEGGSRRRFGPRYLGLRRATEARARELFVAAGGRPVRTSPHYFVLGESAWFAGLHDEPREVRLPLSALPDPVTSFTWTDSITALGLGEELGVPSAPPGQRGLHRLAALDPSRVREPAAAGGAGYEGYQFRVLDHYVEVQLWSDEPVAAYLG
jgi:hypothetical protein